MPPKELYPKARGYVLAGFRFCPNRWCPEVMIQEWTAAASPTEIPVEAVRRALDWQVSQGNLERRKEPQTEEPQWRLTEDGKELTNCN